MIQIERISAGAHGKKSKYQIVARTDAGRSIVATLDTIEKAACVLRFIHGANVKGEEYELAVRTLREIDAKENGTEGSDEETEGLSGEADNRVSDGSQGD